MGFAGLTTKSGDSLFVPAWSFSDDDPESSGAIQGFDCGQGILRVPDHLAMPWLIFH